MHLSNWLSAYRQKVFYRAKNSLYECFNNKIITKYDVPTPRYTSYPTVRYWDFSTINEAKWRQSVLETFNAENGELCIYIHLPFCENLCTFCACTKRITKNHTVEDPYILAVLKEWRIYRSMLPLPRNKRNSSWRRNAHFF